MKTIYGAFDLDWLAGCPVVSVDGETTGKYWYRDKLFGVAVAGYDKGTIRSMYIDLREKPQYIKALDRVLPACKRIVNHNIKFDAHFLREAGIRLPMDRIECTSVRAALINEWEPSFSLDALGLKYCEQGKAVGIYEELATMFGGVATREVQMKNLHRAPERLAAKYAVLDPEIAIKLWLWQEIEIERQGLQRVWDLERRLTPVLIEIEQNGVRVDEQRAADSMGEIDGKVTAAQAGLDRVAGKPVNANSAPQMRALFKVTKHEAGSGFVWKTDAGHSLEMTDGGEASIGKAALNAMADLGDERAKHASMIRKLVKAKSFLKDHIIGHAVKGRVYPNYNQTRGDNELGTGTGRFSVNDPALQQIPKRDRDIAAIVRSCFLPEKSERWACADWEQFEFRVFAHYTKDPSIIKVYQDNPDADYHQLVADLTGLPRVARFTGDPNAKQINLGLVFGMGQGEMASQMGLDYTAHEGRGGRVWKRAEQKAMEIFDKYHAAIPGVRKLLDQASSIAGAKGHVETMMGRHLRFPGGKFTHKAGGLVLQGTSADAMKIKMIELAPHAREHGFKILLSVHDELDFSLPVKKAAHQAKFIKQTLETFDGEGCPMSFRVPIRSSVAVGDNWWVACQ